MRALYFLHKAIVNILLGKECEVSFYLSINFSFAGNLGCFLLRTNSFYHFLNAPVLYCYINNHDKGAFPV